MSEDIKKALSKTNPEIKVNDSLGRVIILRKPKPLRIYELVRILGKDAENETYLSMCAGLVWIESIDGNPIPSIEKKLHIDQLIEMLDEEGIEAVNRATLEHVNSVTKKEAVEEIKKS